MEYSPGSHLQDEGRVPPLGVQAGHDGLPLLLAGDQGGQGDHQHQEERGPGHGDHQTSSLKHLTQVRNGFKLSIIVL